MLSRKKINLSVLIILISLLFLCFVIIGCSSVGMPDIQITDPIYDFGSSDQFSITHQFEIKNVGNAPLVIKEPGSSWGWTSSLSGKVIEPGKSATLSVAYRINGQRGKHELKIPIESNDPKKPVVSVIVKGITVSGAIPISPSTIQLGDFDRDKQITKQLQVYDRGMGNLKVTKVEASAPYIQTELKTMSEGELVAEINATIGPGIPPGTIDQTITIYTNDNEFPFVRIPVKGEVPHDISLSEDQFFFNDVEKGTKISHEIRLINNRDVPVKILRITNDLAYVKIDYKATKPGREYLITVNLEVPVSAEGVIKDKIKIYTDHPEESLFTIPLFAIVGCDE